ncbi:hypothetical protein ATANTOWER_025473 [Ataeniobius toweri]|uniref:Uncharacterized protein n=1 Tax=Ataeniobius toweri TaxID=208326 RepID=A0ABU7CCH7_9TELE|nr:hypothetical protein [Ataeniobius toweri]
MEKQMCFNEPAHTKAPRPRHQEPSVHQRAKTPASSRECGGEEIGPTCDGGPKLIQKREQPKTHPDTKTGAHSHNDTFPPSCIHIKTLTPTHPMYGHTTMDAIHLLAPPNILPGPGTETAKGQKALGTKEVVPFIPEITWF